MLARTSLATILGIVGFVAVAAVGFLAACQSSTVAGCTEPYIYPASLLSLAKTGAIVMSAGLALTFLIHKRLWYRRWQLLLAYFLLGALVPRLLSGSNSHVFSAFDLVFPLAGLAMGAVMFFASRTRSNNSFKPKPLRGSA
jgi:hypothetical protein